MRTSLKIMLVSTTLLFACAEPDGSGQTHDDLTAGEQGAPADEKRSEDAEVRYPTELESVRASSFTTSRDRTLCEIFDRSRVAGRFQVERIVTNIDADPWGRSPHDGPVTVITLTTDEVWKGQAGAELKVTTTGGINPDGSMTSTDASFDQSTSVLLFPEHEFADGTWAVRPELVFHQRDDGGYTNGTVLGTAERFTADDIKARLVSVPCADVLPDSELREPSEEQQDEKWHDVVPDEISDGG